MAPSKKSKGTKASTGKGDKGGKAARKSTKPRRSADGPTGKPKPKPKPKSSAKGNKGAGKSGGKTGKAGKAAKAEGPSRSRSSRAKLQFPVGRVLGFLRKGRYGDRTAATSAVYLAAVLEYLTAEVLELAGNSARDRKVQRITPRDIQMAFRGDEELDTMARAVTIAAGGVIPHVNPYLIPPKKQRE